MPRLDNFRNMYADLLRDLYSAESQLIKALPQMAEAATNPELKQALTMHLDQTKQHQELVKGLIDSLGQRASGETCKGMKGIIEEGTEIIEKGRADEDVRDAAIIHAAQSAEHYEMAGYGTARTFAQLLGDQQSAQVLQQILDQEGTADKKLTQIAINRVNQEATQNGSSSRR